MSPDQSHRGSFVARVIAHRAPCRDHFEIECELPAFPTAAPGQFMQLLCRSPENVGKTFPAAAGPMLRRPFSIAGIDRRPDGVRLCFIGRVVGRGTAWLDSLRAGDEIEMLGPLGRPFDDPPPGTLSYLVAGGVGLPPIRWLAEKLREKGLNCVFVFGAQSRDLLPLSLSLEPATNGTPNMCAGELARFDCPAVITTDDGSCGMRGRVTDALSVLLEGSHASASLRVFGCGPEPMLRALARLCDARGIACQLAMERVMGCGMGTCQSCVVPVIDESNARGRRFALCCTEGPVFDSARVVWPD